MVIHQSFNWIYNFWLVNHMVINLLPSEGIIYISLAGQKRISVSRLNRFCHMKILRCWAMCYLLTLHHNICSIAFQEHELVLPHTIIHNCLPWQLQIGFCLINHKIVILYYFGALWFEFFIFVELCFPLRPRVFLLCKDSKWTM